jgi:hypothetical protein
MPVHALHYGKSKKPLAWVKPDERYPTMWRIHWPDGSVSDMVNLARAKDAARAIAFRQVPSGDAGMLRWKTVQNDAEAAYSAFDAAPLSD